MTDLKSLPSHTAMPRGSRWMVPIALVLICAGCLVLRTVWLQDKIFADGEITLQDNDPWYHYRLLEYQIRNLPRPMTFDPYVAWPDGGGVPVGPFFDLVPAAFIRLVGGAEPSQRLIDATAAYFAPVLAMGVCLAVFLAARELFNRWTALIAALLVGVMPGPYFVRSALGFFDHHVMEVLLSTLLLYLLFVVLRRSGLRPSPDVAGGLSDKASDVSLLRDVVPLSAVAGLVLGCYMLTWIAGNYLLLILLGWLVVQHVADHLMGRSTARLSMIVVPCFAVAIGAVMCFPEVGSSRVQAGALASGIVLTLLLSGLSAIMQQRKLRPVLYPLIVLLTGCAALVVMNSVAPTLLGSIRVDIARLLPGMKARTITEARPILYTSTGWSYGPLWSMFGCTFPMALLGLAALVGRFVRRREAGSCLMIVWGFIVFASMFGQSRFAYYAAPVVAILVAFLCHAAVSLVWAWRRKKTKDGAGEPSWLRKSVCAMTAIGLLSLAIVPSSGELTGAAGFYDGPTDDWRGALRWLRENSPEPFGDSDAFFVRSSGMDDLARSVDVSGAYGVMSWWDYGYWISGLARRIPNSNPTQRGAVDSARFLLAQCENEARELLDALSTRYVMLDWLLPRWQKPGGARIMGKYSALPVWLDQDVTRYYERVLMTEDSGRRVLRYIYYPPYFQSMCVRLFIFSALEARPRTPIKVYSLQWQDLKSHGRQRVVKAVHDFETHAEAMAFIDAAEATDDGLTHVCASDSPFETCIPLEALRQFRLVHQSPRKVAVIQGHPVSTVRVFEYTPD